MRNILHFLTILAAVALFAACNSGADEPSDRDDEASMNDEPTERPRQRNAARQDQDAEDDEAHEDDHGHGEDDAEHADRTNPWRGVNDAVCVVMPAGGSEVRGVIRFRKTSKGVRITGEVTGLSPSATHAFHIHEFGDLSVEDGTGAGGHYNPEGHEHGLPDEPAESRHAGDLGNLTTDENGVAKVDITMDNISVAGRDNPIVGRSIIIHAKADDGGQPTGNAGPRIGMGVIGVAKPRR